jgi:hypothetical protein
MKSLDYQRDEVPSESRVRGAKLVEMSFLGDVIDEVRGSGLESSSRW